MEVTFHRYVLAEFNTHRLFSRNSASSRAIPTKKRIEAVRTSPAIPCSWGKNQRGMQASEELLGEDLERAQDLWLKAAAVASEFAEAMDSIGAHKQIANRLLEPFLWHTVVVTSTSWENFFDQRCHPDAQPEIQAAAILMRKALGESEPRELAYGEWHLPFILEDERHIDLEDLIKISCARCARTSYLSHDGTRAIGQDLDLYLKLADHRPMHASPLEHAAMPGEPECWYDNLKGWRSWRYLLERSLGIVSKR